MIAAAATQFPDDRPPLKIAVGIGEAAADPVTFGKHLVTESRRLLDAQLEKPDRQRLSVASAVRKVTTRGGSGGIFELGLPPIKGVSAKAALDLRKSVVQLEEDAGEAGVHGALDALVGVFAAHGLRPVFIFDDTDHWLGRDERGRAVAHEFFAGPIRVIAKDLNNVSAIVATHQEYTDVAGYIDARPLLVEIEVPKLEPPRQALAQILAQHVVRSGVNAKLEDVMDTDAVVRLEAEYERLGRDLRGTLQIAHVALKLAGPAYADKLGLEDVRAAVTYLST